MGHAFLRPSLCTPAIPWSVICTLEDAGVVSSHNLLSIQMTGHSLAANPEETHTLTFFWKPTVSKSM